VDGINATDAAEPIAHVEHWPCGALLTRAGYAPVMQISCRDKNRIAIQGDILGGRRWAVCNILCLSGDGVQSGDHPQAKPCSTWTACRWLQIARMLRDEKRFESGRKLTFARACSWRGPKNPFAPLSSAAPNVSRRSRPAPSSSRPSNCFDIR